MFSRRQPPSLLLLLTSVTLLCAGSATAEGDLRIACLDVGQGDSTVIISPSGRSLLFDGGKNGRGDDVVLPYLASVGIDTLDCMVASHYHSDHVGGLDEVYEAIPVREGVFDRGWDYSTLTYGDYAEAVAPQRQTITRGQVFDLGEGVTVTCVAVNTNDVLDPPYNYNNEENEYSVALLVEYGGFDFVVAGDLTGGNGYYDIETTVGPQVGDVDVYRVNHHASISSSNHAFMQAIAAEVSIISVGDNTYGHPSQTILDRLVEYGTFVYQTEAGDGGTLPPENLKVVNGHIEIVTDGRSTYTVDGDSYALDEEVLSAVGPMSQAFRMLGNHPNPFNPSTIIRFEIERAGPAQLDVFDMAGRRVHQRDFQAEEGPNALVFQGQDRHGGALPAGVYLYRVKSDAGMGQGRMVLIK